MAITSIITHIITTPAMTPAITGIGSELDEDEEAPEIWEVGISTGVSVNFKPYN